MTVARRKKDEILRIQLESGAGASLSIEGNTKIKECMECIWCRAWIRPICSVFWGKGTGFGIKHTARVLQLSTFFVSYGCLSGFPQSGLLGCNGRWPLTANTTIESMIFEPNLQASKRTAWQSPLSPTR